MSHEDEQTLGKFEPGDIVEAGELGRGRILTGAPHDTESSDLTHDFSCWPRNALAIAANSMSRAVRDLNVRNISSRRCPLAALSARFAWLRVWPAYGWAQGECAGAATHWLLIERREDGSVRYAFSNLPANTSRLTAVRYWHSRWPVEQGYQQMKEELGLDHFEGRSWPGFHRHAVLVMMAYGFLTLERMRLQERAEQQQQQQQQEVDRTATTVPARRTKRRRGDGDEPYGPRLTLPAVRRALQRFLLPACHLNCPYCRALAHR